MKIQTRTLLLAASLFLLIASLSVVAQAPPDLEITDLQLTYDVNRRFDLHGNFSGKTDLSIPSITAYPVQELSALIRNTGMKSIRSVIWECLLFKDAGETKLARVYRVRAQTLLFPGESVRLRKSGYNLLTSPYQKARITRIEYTDGTFWQGKKL